MKNANWLAEVYHWAKEDVYHAECLADVRRLTPAYEIIQAALPESQQAQPEDYIAACEELAHSLILPAYETGREHGKIIIINSANP